MMTRDELERQIERDMDSRYGEFMVNGGVDIRIKVVDEIDEDETLCFYCGEWEPEDKHIYFVLDGKVECCCEKCLWGMIEEDGMYEDAIMVLRNRIGNNTGILAVDMMADKLIAELERANEAQLRRDGALYQISKLMKVGA
jgi:hypothetical protein